MLAPFVHSYIRNSAIASLALALTWLAAASPAFAITRWVFDCGDPFGDTNCYMDYLDDDYFYGRSEGQPPRGPNPLGPPYSGSTDVDILYDMTGVYHQYLLDTFNRNGPNGVGGTGNGITVPLNVYRLFANGNGSSIGQTLCNVPAGVPSAAATTTSCVFCRGSATLDILGHEMTHIMARNELALGSTGEAGALNEAISDVFGESFERYVTGSNDWIIGTGHPIHVRSLADPPSQTQGPYASPDRYLSPDFYTGPDDGGGVHINAGVLGKGTFLASEGGVFNGYTIAGIGFDKVEQIWYRALTEYFVIGETFNMAYAHLVQAAGDLYSPYDVNQVTLALRAVEMHRVRGVPEPSAMVLVLGVVLSLLVTRQR